MKKWGLISLDGRWIDFRSLWSRSMSPAITISDRFRSVVSLREFWPAASNPIHPVAHSIPSLLLIQPLILLDHGPPPEAHYLIENNSARRALVSNYRCACVSKIIFSFHLFYFFLDFCRCMQGLTKVDFDILWSAKNWLIRFYLPSTGFPAFFYSNRSFQDIFYFVLLRFSLFCLTGKRENVWFIHRLEFL